MTALEQPQPATQWFRDAVGGDPLECVLLDGPRAGETVTTVPAGARFRFVDDTISYRAFCRPADTSGG